MKTTQLGAGPGNNAWFHQPLGEPVWLKDRCLTYKRSGASLPNGDDDWKKGNRDLLYVLAVVLSLLFLLSLWKHEVNPLDKARVGGMPKDMVRETEKEWYEKSNHNKLSYPFKSQEYKNSHP